MVFSAIGTGLILLTQDSEEPTVTSQDVETQLQDQINQQIEQEAALTGIDRVLPEGEVTELVTEDLVVGDGTEVVAGDAVTVHYTGWLATDGTVFDSSVARGETISFPLGNVIQGWQEGIPGMKIGGKRRLTIPPELAYGAGGTPDGSIPPNTAIVFEVELFGIGDN